MNETFYFRESLEDSFIYRTFNNSNGILSQMVNYIRLSDTISAEEIDDQYRQIKRSSVSPLSRSVISAYDSGLIEIRYSGDAKIRMPSSIPFIVRKNGDKVIATIFIKSFTSVADGMLTIPTKNLYAIMESAYITLCIHQYPEKLLRNTTLAKTLMSVYTQMVMKILIKEFALSMDRPLCDEVKYCVSRFFLEKMWGITNEEIVDAYASADLEFLTSLLHDEIVDRYVGKDIKDINDLIELIASLSARLKSLNSKYFIEKWISNYHAPAILSMDYLPYLFFVINNVILGSFLVSQNALTDIVKSTKGMSHYYSELAKCYT